MFKWLHEIDSFNGCNNKKIEPKNFDLIYYCCPFQACNREYKNKINLKKHVLCYHLGSKPFNCETCKKSFVSKQNLNEHKFIHVGVKPYKCIHCGMNFRQNSQLSCHKRLHNLSYQIILKKELEIKKLADKKKN